ncbi:hypothetical protein A2661_01065 [Candidatus Giovannonibacteria bacterium RIFCSPHIGHO2_01_FULL_45_24]|nr:MAG: hypothetical protein A2661_01065 [Candidatus Giovannonibacteria bacterium RIFCSPHIGHO2_01_FULL_45_24]
MQTSRHNAIRSPCNGVYLNLPAYTAICQRAPSASLSKQNKYSQSPHTEDMREISPEEKAYATEPV